MGSNLRSWHRAQVTVSPRNPFVTTSMRSLMMSLLFSLKMLAQGQKTHCRQIIQVISSKF